MKYENNVIRVPIENNFLYVILSLIYPQINAPNAQPIPIKIKLMVKNFYLLDLSGENTKS